MTHVLNHALREVVGGGIDQQGSIVDHKRLRFDFNNDKLELEQIEAIQNFVNQQIRAELVVYEKEVEKETAFNIGCLRAMFIDKYPDIVRIISVGAPVEEILADPKNEKWSQYSVELCGGTHITNTKDAGSFYITSEEALMEGVRRIVGVTGNEATILRQNCEEMSRRIESCFDLEPTDLTTELKSIKKNMQIQMPILERRRFQDMISKLDGIDKKNKKQAKQVLKKMAMEVMNGMDINGPFVIQKFRIRSDAKTLGDLSKKFAKKHKNTCAILYSTDEDGKQQVIIKAVIPKKLSKTISAKDWISVTKELIDGGAGGGPTNASAQGKSMEKVDEAMNALRTWISSRLESTI